jgi:hypothetical protein
LTHSDAFLYLRDIKAIKGKRENEVFVGRSCSYEKISEFKFFAYSSFIARYTVEYYHAVVTQTDEKFGERICRVTAIGRHR